jgi:hypothetical protein
MSEERTYTQGEWDAQQAEYFRLHGLHHHEQGRLTGIVHEQDREIMRLQRRIAAFERAGCVPDVVATL